MAELPQDSSPRPLLETFSTLANPGSEYLNREMSWLAFNERVLAEAKDERNPLLERLKFAAICGSNLDEFFMVRVAGIHQQIAAGVQTPSLDGLLPREVLRLVREHTQAMMTEIETVTRRIFAALEEQGVRIWRMDELDEGDRAQARAHYLSQIQPVLTPLVVDPSHPFPYISNLSLNLAVLLEGKKKKTDPDFARVKVPVGVLPRLVDIGGKLLLLEDIMAAHMGELFRGRRVQAAYLFRVTRNTDFDFDEDEAEDLLATVEDGLRRRRFGNPVRLEVMDNLPRRLVRYLQERMNISPQDVYQLSGPLGTSDLMGLPVDRPDLSFAAHQPHLHPFVRGDDECIFDVLQRRDILLHHPYDSFEHVLNFLEEAAADPSVLAIKQTLYRTGDDSRLLGALRSAAEAGKQVVAFIELKARFDEQRNISWAKQLERAGAHVVHGMAGLKTHAKVTLVVRREGGGLRRYVHIGTGNYNPKTARLYTDLSLLTANDELGADATELFNHLTGYAEAEYRHMLVAPHSARSGFIERLEREAEVARQGGDAWFVGKCNQLTDPAMIEALYRASQAGVRVQMVIRGVCCLRPGVPGMSENIQIRSLLGRFLEHSRIYAYGNGGNPEVYFGSADWMSRNLDRRVEVLAPVLVPHLRDEFLDIMQTELSDERGSWVLDEAGVYAKLSGDRSAQAEFAEDNLI
ncbi:polyphosphate kinase 1 [Deinococcus radiophilus]|uniref:Polyphosphate kinase n=1 Tax=Deinococcus radiophilus TaxID=32062 RepID=A0A3S0RK33_9DEIO|nr:polyphosphate kinase 1 [Deinococcus radiophilus]RTR30358.1 polyphosphate kinase 1 [Deinococcus radiophilus]UFA51423.1 polyphosphate kinase 1 [Deinococcus radiophilus]